MFTGDTSFEGCPILLEIILFIGLLTLVLASVQDCNLEILALDVVQTLICWPSLLEGVVATGCLWAMRNVERILGFRGLAVYLVYHAVTYSIPFALVLTTQGFHGHYSLPNFVPHALFAFALWRLPAIRGPLLIPDKICVTAAVALLVADCYPQSLLTLLAAAAGYWLWSLDALGLKRRALAAHRRPP
jgi:hypothetical protein